jgi:UDP-N-acetyl-2-amino-2-deoxyglucuronate dehydrogenase
MIKIGLVGCGRISGNHFKAIKEHENRCKLVAVCDNNKDRAEKAGKENNCNFYTSLDQMLKFEKLDLVSVCTPSGLHPRHGIQVAKGGFNVLTEKPIGINLNEVDELIKTCDE